MGEFADMAIEQGIAQMTDQDYDPGYDCYQYGGIGNSTRSIRRCGYCGTSNLRWSKIEHKWRMIAPDGTPHACQEYRDTKRKGDPDPDPTNGSDGADPAQLGE